MEPTTGPATTGPATTGPAPSPRAVEPDRLTRSILNPVVIAAARIGLSLWGARVLEVPGRCTGAVRTTPVNVLELAGERYLVAPRGCTEWVRNVRAAGGATLRLGRRREAVRTVEVADRDKVTVLRAYLRRWQFEVGRFFDCVGPDAPDAELARIAAGYPVFR
ncbi:MAG: nitroreductase family deazaflavin-dependent oxidoreductase, partial [Acidimicrobiales bacterium]|nr:nitroreductase family deazaflavin-dependent oxidoreductase [Acidimicrobiales bacterium]